MAKLDRVVEISNSVVALLREERQRAGLSMNAVAERSGLSQQMVSYVERGMRKPTLDTLLRIAKALDVRLSEVIAAAELTNQSKVR